MSFHKILHINAFIFFKILKDFPYIISFLSHIKLFTLLKADKLFNKAVSTTTIYYIDFYCINLF